MGEGEWVEENEWRMNKSACEVLRHYTPDQKLTEGSELQNRSISTTAVTCSP